MRSVLQMPVVSVGHDAGVDLQHLLLHALQPVRVVCGDVGRLVVLSSLNRPPGERSGARWHSLE